MLYQQKAKEEYLVVSKFCDFVMIKLSKDMIVKELSQATIEILNIGDIESYNISLKELCDISGISYPVLSMDEGNLNLESSYGDTKKENQKVEIRWSYDKVIEDNEEMSFVLIGLPYYHKINNNPYSHLQIVDNLLGINHNKSIPAKVTKSLLVSKDGSNAEKVDSNHYSNISPIPHDKYNNIMNNLYNLGLLSLSSQNILGMESLVLNEKEKNIVEAFANKSALDEISSELGISTNQLGASLNNMKPRSNGYSVLELGYIFGRYVS